MARLVSVEACDPSAEALVEVNDPIVFFFFFFFLLVSAGRASGDLRCTRLRTRRNPNRGDERPDQEHEDRKHRRHNDPGNRLSVLRPTFRRLAAVAGG